MKMKTGDNIIMIAGKDRGRKGKVIRTFPSKGKIVVEGMNIRKKHVRARKQGEKGQVAHMPGPFDISNAMFFCEHCKKGVKVGYTMSENTKQRVCKKCGTGV
jgi:large subunit ribosomal protein L24